VWSSGHMVKRSHGHVVTDSFLMVIDCDPSCSSKYSIYWSDHLLNSSPTNKAIHWTGRIDLARRLSVGQRSGLLAVYEKIEVWKQAV